jgi:four helix bundle protein
MDVKRKEFIRSTKQRMLAYSVSIINFIDSLPKELSTTILARQLLRSATSIGANFVEAQAAPSRKDFANFMSIALKSANETQYWFELFGQAKKGDPKKIMSLQAETVEFSNLLGSIVKSLRAKI